MTEQNKLIEQQKKDRIEMESQPKLENMGEYILISKGIMKSSELNSSVIEDRFLEYHVMCRIFLVDSDLHNKFRGKNLTITVDDFVIQNDFTWNLSGKETEQYKSGAMQDENKIGIDGKDGNAGESGGIFELKCKQIKNGNKLTIISNGADGGNGQNGGDGKIGKNGKSATLGSFYKNNFEWKTYYGKANRNKMKRIFDLEYDGKSNVVTDDGLEGEIYIQENFRGLWGIMLVKGTDGEEGTPGGLGGLGGEGGYPGKIVIDCDTESNIVTVTNKGKEGKNGIKGKDGVSGKNGGDIVKYDSSWSADMSVYGENEKRKYELKVTSNSSGIESEYIKYGRSYVMKNCLGKVSEPKPVAPKEEIKDMRRSENAIALEKTELYFSVSNHQSESESDLSNIDELSED